MPLHKIDWNDSGCGWAVWSITESEASLGALAFPEVCPEDIHRSSKRAEWLAGRVLVKYLAEKAGLAYAGMRKDINGKPFLTHHDHAISLSHSFPYVAVQMDNQISVGIDVEQPKAKLLRIAPRILSATEQQDAGADIAKNCIYWCAKEALYKIHVQRGLTFAEHLSVKPFSLRSEGQLIGAISSGGSHQLINLGYRLEKDFVLVYTKIK